MPMPHRTFAQVARRRLQGREGSERVRTINALLTERLPGNIPLTRDLLKMLEQGDNVVSGDEAVRAFALPLLPLDDQLRRAA